MGIMAAAEIGDFSEHKTLLSCYTQSCLEAVQPQYSTVRH